MTPGTDAELLALVDASTRAVVVRGGSAITDTSDMSVIEMTRYVFGDEDRAPNEAHWASGRFVVVSTRSYNSAWHALREPAKVIRAVLPLQGMRILLDRDGEMARIQEQARRFEWSDIREAARSWTVREIVLAGKYLLKVRSAIEQRDKSSAVNAAIRLALKCTDIVLVHRRGLVPSEDRYHETAWRVGGSEFELFQQGALGIDPPNELTAPLSQARAAESLYLVVQGMLIDDGVLETGSEENHLIQRAWYAPNGPPDRAW